LSLFRAEFEILNRGEGEIRAVKEKFRSIRSKHDKSERLRHRGKPGVIAKESVVATAAVSFTTHFAAMAVLGEAAEKDPTYWNMTTLSAVVATLINFADFYFKFFSVATSRLRHIEDRLRRTTKGTSSELFEEEN
jgi:hypothetical protein